MHRTYLGNSLLYHLGKHEWTQAALAERAAVTQSSLSRLISARQRPETSTLRALCTCWPDPGSNLRVLIEHLRDEMVRGGHRGEGELEFRPHAPGAAALERDLALVCETASLDDDVAALLHDLAVLLRRAKSTSKTPPKKS
jgi:transcriptional regulator with XRE-family HTH domain